MLKCSSCQAFLCVSLQLAFDFNKCTYAGVQRVQVVGCRVWGCKCFVMCINDFHSLVLRGAGCLFLKIKCELGFP